MTQGNPSMNGGPETGFQVYRASRLEALIAPLWALLDLTWPDNVLQPHTVIAAHPGMKQWLSGALARHQGVQGIAANLDILLPSAWIERQAHAHLGSGAVALPRYQVAHLRWSLHGLLDSRHSVPGMRDARVANYLSGATSAAEAARRRFQLADRLARIYSQYVIYRPDWLQAWEAGKFNYAGGQGLESELLGPLWRAVQTRLGRHRGHAMQELIGALKADPTERPVLHVFGVSHLAPSELQVLRAYAEGALVALYIPDPCLEYWGGLKITAPSEWQTYRAEEQQRLADAGEGEYWQELGHPLLARWGRLGQHFFSQLTDGPIRDDQRHWQDKAKPNPVNRLERLQESIRQLKPELMTPPGDAATEMADASLRVHACHTRQRELEVLRDVLLDALASGIAPGEMMVMAPDISAYVPLIPAVFGEAASARELLPYHLADVPVSRSHGLFTLLRQLLALPGQRITAPEVADLLAVPEVQRRLGLDADATEALRDWLRQSRVAWSLDAQHRAGFDVPAVSEHGFAWAVDRMIAGYLMSDAPESDRDHALLLPDGSEVLPVTGIHGPGAQALGALDYLLQEVQAWCDLASRECTAAEWQALLTHRLEALLRIDPNDAAAESAWNALLRFVGQMALETEVAEENPRLHFAVMREVLLERLSGVAERQRFLMGGITFCGMVPQRAIPFRMLAVLGLNDGEFPRRRSDGGLDLMTRLRRVGDRDVRSDDRYLFLETLMAARDRLHLSYLGESVKDGKPRNPAAPLAELMAELDPGTDQHPSAPWWVKHPLQPFDARYFDQRDPRLFSFDARFARMQGKGRTHPLRFLDGTPAIETALPAQVALPVLRDYFSDPARHLLEKRLQLRLDALDTDRLAEDEPMDGRLDPMATVARRVFFGEALPAGLAWDATQIPDWVRCSGLLPSGPGGLAAWQQEAASVCSALQCVQASELLDAESAAQALQENVDDVFTVNGRTCRLNGRIDHVYAMAGQAQGRVLVRMYPNAGKGELKSESELHFGERVAAFLDWALLRLRIASPAPVRLLLLCKPGKQNWQDSINLWDAAYLAADATSQAGHRADLERRIAWLLQQWHQAEILPPLYFARTSWAAAQDDAEDAAKAQNIWHSTHNGGGEQAYGQGYNGLLAGDLDFEADPKAYQALREFALDLKARISFPEAQA
ncbi:exodeoxyribonuclease V subunit gamma [Arenimonas sp. GDDSR-1]|uniref:exodeoxyribonuclease V subunit gamma n=1 Tax=Arenimonas sp. GDDSR-1 TaxID=2950125 RepID=UPI002618FBDB|nr:exodeoxyribonuclease V subunit gamma [Arenimonas sp. GDDSR-1]